MKFELVFGRVPPLRGTVSNVVPISFPANEARGYVKLETL
jgi:hypothetical protein